MARFANRVAITDPTNRTSLVMFFVLAYLLFWLLWGLESRGWIASWRVGRTGLEHDEIRH